MIMIYELRWEAVSPPVRNITPSATGSLKERRILQLEVRFILDML
jgi:hypothetical protein